MVKKNNKSTKAASALTSNQGSLNTVATKIEKQGGLSMKKIPDFTLASTSGEDFKLSNFRGKKIVLYFYPKDSTPGCTTEGLQFSALNGQFEKLNTVVFGVSRDSLASHDKFRCKQDFKFHLLSDNEQVACQIFDVIKEKNMYGKMVLGIERSTFLISEEGELLNEWRKVKADGHASQVLSFIESLSS